VLLTWELGDAGRIYVAQVVLSIDLPDGDRLLREGLLAPLLAAGGGGSVSHCGAELGHTCIIGLTLFRPTAIPVALSRINRFSRSNDRSLLSVRQGTSHG
jgi:hypothetical protein